SHRIEQLAALVGFHLIERSAGHGTSRGLNSSIRIGAPGAGDFCALLSRRRILDRKPPAIQSIDPTAVDIVLPVAPDLRHRTSSLAAGPLLQPALDDILFERP